MLYKRFNFDFESPKNALEECFKKGLIALFDMEESTTGVMAGLTAFEKSMHEAAKLCRTHLISAPLVSYVREVQKLVAQLSDSEDSSALSAQSDLSEGEERVVVGEKKRGGLLSSFTSGLKAMCASVVDFGTWMCAAGKIQHRLYHHLMAALLEALLDGFEGTLEQKLLDEYGFDMNAPKEGLETHLKLALEHLLTSTRVDAQVSSERYKFFIELDAAYKLRGTSPGAEKFLRKLGFCLFTQIQLHEYVDDAVHTVLQNGNQETKIELEPDENLYELFAKDHATIKEAAADLTGGFFFANWNKILGHANVNFEPLKWNNFVSRIWDCKVRMLRFGSPTVERIDGKKVEAETQFLLFLDYLKENGGCLASFQLQNRKNKNGTIGDEYQRLQVMIHDLGESEEYRDVIKVFAFPMDDGFYTQSEGEWAADNLPATKFIDAFYDRISGVDNSSKFSIPVEICEKEIRLIINQVHLLILGGKEMLSNDERQIFQLISYAFLEEYFINFCDATDAHSQCKDAMDRAMSLQALLYYFSLIRHGQHRNPKYLRIFRTLVHFAPLLIKGVPMHGKRFALFQKVMNHLMTIGPKTLDNIGKFKIIVKGKEVEPMKPSISSRPNTTFLTLPSHAKTHKEYYELFDGDQKMQRAFHVHSGQNIDLLLKQRYENQELGVKLEQLDPNIYKLEFTQADAESLKYAYIGGQLEDQVFKWEITYDRPALADRSASTGEYMHV